VYTISVSSREGTGHLARGRAPQWDAQPMREPVRSREMAFRSLTADRVAHTLLTVYRFRRDPRPTQTAARNGQPDLGYGDLQRPGAIGWADPQHRFLLLLLAVGVLIFWLPRLPGSLWVDETTTAWTVSTSFGQMLDRSVEFQSMSPTYFSLAWLARRLGGTSEIALRIPSVIAMALATYLLYRLGRRLFEAETGLIAAVVLVTSNAGAHLATDARPYALGILAFIAATLSLIRWVDDGRTRDGLAYLVLVALVLYAHYILAPVLLAHVVYVWVRRHDLPSRWAVVAGGALFALLVLPLVPIVLSTLGEREALSLGMPHLGAVLFVILPPEVLVAMAAGIAVVAGRMRRDADVAARDPAALALLWVWVAAPPIALFAITWLIGAGVLGPQHVTVSAPAVALLAAWAIRHLAPSQVRRIVVVCMVIVSLILGNSHRQYTDDWRQAIAYANALVVDPSTPVLVRSGLVQTSRIDWLTDAHRTPILLAPVKAYPVDGAPVALPFGLSAAERRYLEEEVVPIAGSLSRLAVISWSIEDRVLPWLQGRLRSTGFELRDRRTFGSVVVAVFERA